MSKINRRELLGGGLATLSLAGFNVVGSSTHARAQSDPVFRYVPDALIKLGGKDVGIDIALLGNNGEETAGFYAALDPFHGTPFEQTWLNFYGIGLMKDPQNHNPWDPRPLTDSEARNTDRKKVDEVITHLSVHGFRYEKDLRPIYELALKAWQNRADLRVNDGPG